MYHLPLGKAVSAQPRDAFSSEEASGNQEQRQEDQYEHKNHEPDQAPDVRPTLLIPVVRLRRPPAFGTEFRRRGVSCQAVGADFRVHLLRQQYKRQRFLISPYDIERRNA
jgi:hypothetical protein